MIESPELRRRPHVSILMGVYNCAEYVDESIGSLLLQSFSDWELIVCDDGSSDDTLLTVSAWQTRDPRIRVFANGANRGLAWTLNEAAGHARGELLARQDGDDRSTPDRLEKEVNFLAENPAVAIVSAGMTLFDERGSWGRIYNPEWPTERDFVAKSPFSHAASMVRREAFEAVAGYRSVRHTWRVEDYDLWFRLYQRGYRGHNIQDCLYEVRDDRDAYARRKFRYRLNETLVKLEGFRRLGVPPTDYLRALRPLAVGLVPPSAYLYLRRRRYAQDGPDT